jgi:hypothetical protein
MRGIVFPISDYHASYFGPADGLPPADAPPPMRTLSIQRVGAADFDVPDGSARFRAAMEFRMKTGLRAGVILRIGSEEAILRPALVEAIVKAMTAPA